MPAAARVGDPTSHPGSVLPPGVPTVLVEGMPAAVVGGSTVCTMPPPSGPHGVTPIMPPGSKTVLIGGQPAARVRDRAGCGQTIVRGATQVLIGD
jgi:uncharacterized Zn-binding protein involved in type VI secretion